MKKNILSRIIMLWFIAIFLFSCRADNSKSEITWEVRNKNVKLKNLLGINAFEWDFLQDPGNPNDGSRIYEPKFELIKSFGGVRHYMDWDKIEHKQGAYTFNPTFHGGWNYDTLYHRSKMEGIPVLVCMQNTPEWIYKDYPAKFRGAGNNPAPYGSNLEDPKSYIAQSKAAFQFAARYGANKNIDPSLVKVYSTPRWNDDPVNKVKIGLDYIKYIECENEPDKWWFDSNCQLTPRQYAANLSAFYDGHMGKLGKGVGVKAADPSMTVVMGGIARPDANYVKEMVEWCKENRGYKPDGSINLCFDVINFHMYSNDYIGWFADFRSKKRGVAPETNDMGKVAISFQDLVDDLGKKVEIWVTETGYDLNENSVQRAIPIGDKSAELTQADWIIRTSLMYARHGISRVFYYQLYDTMKPGTSDDVALGTAGLLSDGKRRAAASYLLQVKKIFGEYTYSNTVMDDPIVDIYTLGKKRMYTLVVPDETGRKEDYELNLGKAKKARIYHLQPDSDNALVVEKDINNGILKLEVTETPIFVQPM